MQLARYVAIGGSGVLIAYCSLQLIAADGDVVSSAPGLTAVLLMAALASFGTLLGRAPQAPSITLGAGILGLIDSVSALAAGSAPHGVVVLGAACLVSAALIASGVLLRRAANTGDGQSVA